MQKSDSTTKRDSATQNNPPANDDSKWRDLHGGLVAKMRIEKLHEAMKRREKVELKSAIEEAKAAGLNPEADILWQAELELQALEIKSELRTAVSEKDPEAIRSLVYKITSHRQYHARLQQDVSEALRELGQIERVQKIGSYVMDMDRKTIGEMRRYHHPPELVHQLMKAIMLLFKENEEVTEVWSVCQQHLQPGGSQGMTKRVMDFDPSTVHPEIASRVDEMLKQINLQKLQEVSSGAATFYVWAKGVVEAVNPKSSGGKVHPADVKRQKEIFSPTPPSPQRKRKQMKHNEAFMTQSPRK